MVPIVAHSPRALSSPDLKALEQIPRPVWEDAYVLTAVPLSQAARVTVPSFMAPPRTLGLRSQDNKYFLLRKQVAEESESFLSTLARGDLPACRDVHGNYSVPVMGKPLRAIIKYLTLGELPPAQEYRAVRAAARHLCITSLVAALDAPAVMPANFEYAPDLTLAPPVPSEGATERFQDYYKVDTKSAATEAKVTALAGLESSLKVREEVLSTLQADLVEREEKVAEVQAQLDARAEALCRKKGGAKLWAKFAKRFEVDNSHGAQ